MAVLMSPNEVAELLGVTSDRVERLTEAGRLKGVRVGKMLGESGVRYLRGDVDAFVASIQGDSDLAAGEPSGIAAGLAEAERRWGKDGTGTAQRARHLAERRAASDARRA